MINLYKLISRNRLALFGGVLLILIFIISFLSPILPLKDPDITKTSDRFLLPFSDGYLLGTDHLGRDLLSRLLWGTRLSLLVGISAALISATIGSILGTIAGFYGNKTDNVIMRLIDVLMAFPYILLALAIVAVLGPGLFNAMIAVALVNIPFFARNIRGVTVTIANKEFIEAAKLSGMNNFQIIIYEIFPNILPVIVVTISTTIGWMILETAGLSFLGLGSQPPQADLGSMLGEARSALIVNPHTSYVPGAMIFLIVIGVNLFGDGIRDALDPRLSKGQLIKPQPVTQIKSLGKVNPKPNTFFSVENLTTAFEFDKKLYLASKNVSFDIKKGECLGLIGESGSGKSVTALSITCLVASPPGVITDGSINYSGKNILEMDYEELRKIRGNKISYIFQDPLSTLHPLIKIGKQLEEAFIEHSESKNNEASLRGKELLKLVQIPNIENVWNSYPHELSGGMRQRVSIAMALTNDPELIIADEPTTALDVTVQAQILSILDSLRKKRGLSVLFISHDFGVVSQICDRVIVMYGGQIVEQGKTENIMKQPRHPYTKQLMECVPHIGYGKRKLPTILGSPPSITHKKQLGCSFADRCFNKKNNCMELNIEISKKGDSDVRCLYPHE
ncbi:MAG: dipeptide/oligopeptide/nickel ABC transporter permease/ATP-binding protein [Methylophilaceae bacterium]|jgi:peptide/nickel transport system permease protein